MSLKIVYDNLSFSEQVDLVVFGWMVVDLPPIFLQEFVYNNALLKKIHIHENRLVWCPGQNIRIAPLSFFHEYRNCSQRAMSLPPHFGKMWAPWRNI
jgi:hypothetical protein